MTDRDFGFSVAGLGAYYSTLDSAALIARYL